MFWNPWEWKMKRKCLKNIWHFNEVLCLIFTDIIKSLASLLTIFYSLKSKSRWGETRFPKNKSREQPIQTTASESAALQDSTPPSWSFADLWGANDIGWEGLRSQGCLTPFIQRDTGIRCLIWTSQLQLVRSKTKRLTERGGRPTLHSFDFQKTSNSELKTLSKPQMPGLHTTPVSLSPSARWSV